MKINQDYLKVRRFGKILRGNEYKIEFECNNKQYHKLAAIFFLGVVLLVAGYFVSGCNNMAIAYNGDISVDIIEQIESSGNPLAYNAGSGARGLCQITPVVLMEYNHEHGTKYNNQSLFNGEFNRKVALWYLNVKIPAYLRHYRLKDTIKNRIIAYNAGIRAVKRGYFPDESRKYILKYERLM